MMLHSPLYSPEPWTEKKYLKKKIKISSHPLGHLCLEWRNLHAARRRMKRQMCCSFLCEVINCVLSNVVPTSIWSCSRLCVVLNQWQYLFQNERLFVYNIYCPQTLIQGCDLFSEGCMSYILAFGPALSSGLSGVFKCW